jgi:hypothetical protein
MKCKFFLFSSLLFSFSCRTKFPVKEVSFPVRTDEHQLMQGRKLTISICAPCHYDPTTKKLTGKQMFDLPGIAGTVYSRNITKHPEKGIAHYTDGQLAYLIRTGIAKDGSLMSYMQRPNLADVDLQAIIAFLRSDHDIVAPSDVEPPETKYTAFGQFGVNHFPGPLRYPDHSINKPDVNNDAVAYGRYLVDNLSCYHCHSKSFLTVNEIQPEKSKGYMAGGNKLQTASGKKIESANLTFDETGLMKWNEDDFARAVQEGLSKNERILNELMPRYTELSDTDIKAIFHYLETIPKIKNKIDH